MHRPAAVEAALSTERRGECSHTTSQPYSAAARAPVYPEARELRWTRKGVVFQQHYRLLPQTIFECTTVLNSIAEGPMGDGFGCGDGSCIYWRPRRLARVFPAL